MIELWLKSVLQQGFQRKGQDLPIQKASKQEEVDFTVATMECVLEFLYSGSLRREVVDAVELVRAGVDFRVGLSD